MMEEQFPIYPQSIALPILAFPSWMFCVAPMFWQLSQRNIAAGSLILWMIFLNFFNSINPLIWPRDNMQEWWNGEGLCDVEVHIQVGAVVALAACAAVLARRLSNVMDTRNIRIVPSKRSILIERCLEIGFCWVYPAILMVTYYIVQPFRYFLYGISGCVAAYDSSWPSLAVVWIWGCITTLVAAFYSGLLVFRLYHYRREFHSLIAARNTTKSRFMRLFTMALVTSVILLPYSFFVLYQLAINIVDDYSWSKVHGDQWNAVVKVPSYGAARWDRWGEVATGYVMFLCFGTGSDANNTYKHMLTSIGLGKLFPSLYIMSESRNARSPTNVTFGRRLTSSFSTKAKSLFSKNDSISGPSRNKSFAGPTAQPTSASASVTEPILSQQQLGKKFHSNLPSFFGRMFNRTGQVSILPLHGGSSIQVDRLPPLDRTSSGPTVFTAHAWAADNASIEKNNENPGVYVVHEVHQASQDKSKQKLDNDAWV